MTTRYPNGKDNWLYHTLLEKHDKDPVKQRYNGEFSFGSCDKVTLHTYINQLSPINETPPISPELMSNVLKKSQTK